MEPWKEFHEQARQDLKSSKKLLRIENFGNSAYLLQQSTEKYIKAVIYKYDLFNVPAHKLTHEPMIKLLGKLDKMLGPQLVRQHKFSSLPNIKVIFNELKSLFDYKDGDERDETMQRMWQESLNISIENDKNEITFLAKLETIKSKFKNAIKEYTTLYNEKQSNISKSNKKPLQGIFDIIYEFLHMYEDDKLKLDKKHIDEIAKKLITVLESANKIGSMYEIGGAISQMLRIFLILAFSNVILKTHPHESIGRYPVEIDGESSRTRYQEQSKELTKLSKDVEMTCSIFDNMLSDKNDPIRVEQFCLAISRSILTYYRSFMKRMPRLGSAKLADNRRKN